MSYMNETLNLDNPNIKNLSTFGDKKSDFINIYNKSYRLAAAVFMISNLIDENEELKTKIKELSLELVSMSVRLKDINFSDAAKLMIGIEKISLELMSLLDIASLSGLISKMNSSVLKEEFQSFLIELGRFSEKFEVNKNVSVKSIFTQAPAVKLEDEVGRDLSLESKAKPISELVNGNGAKNGNGHKRKELRKHTIFEFIKGHNGVSIKDIVPNIIGCSEKTVQRELIALINEGKIMKVGERRWSKYSAI